MTIDHTFTYLWIIRTFRHHDSAIHQRLRELSWRKLQGVHAAPGGPLVRLACTDARVTPTPAQGWGEPPAMFQKWQRDKAAQRVIAEKSFNEWQLEMVEKEEKAQKAEEDHKARPNWMVFHITLSLTLIGRQS